MNHDFDIHQLKQERRLEYIDIAAELMINLIRNDKFNPLKKLNFHEVLTMKIKDGMCLSVLGKAIYDSESGGVKLENLKTVFAGGLYEAQKYLKTKIHNLRFARLFFGSLGIIFLISTGLRLFFNLQWANTQRRLDEARR